MRRPNQDGTLNTTANPARVGSAVSVFATGLGAITPPQADGAIIGTPLPTDVLPAEVYRRDPTFFIGSLASANDVSYAGPAPFMHENLGRHDPATDTKIIGAGRSIGRG
jgi:uncharacterized protein (TIGR03437 family)